MTHFIAAAAIAAAHTPPYAHTQAVCTSNQVSGIVLDPTGALMPGAALALDGKDSGTAGSDARFRLCVSSSPHRLTVQADGFATITIFLRSGRTDKLQIKLIPSTSTEITVEANASSSATRGGITGVTLEGSRLQSLADDPDDLLRELQQMAAASGGSPLTTAVSVDGFQGNSQLPPKSSIALIRVNPDMFSAEYREAPISGGRVEVYTKPGASAFHGSLFNANSSSWMNARDPFSVSRATIGKQRCGLQLGGPLQNKGSNFSLTLEHRSIDNFAVVNAVRIDPTGDLTNIIANVPIPQHLWLGTSRVDWQLGPKNVALVSYSAYVNHLSNVGVGGVSLAETGYSSEQRQHTVRLSNVTTLSSRLAHEARLGLEWRGETDVPASSAPGLQVSGSFTGGGSLLGPQRIHEFRMEWDDDFILVVKKHQVKAGLQVMSFDEHRFLPTNFNGAYVFGGGTTSVLDTNNRPTGQTTTISGLEQYRRAVLGLWGGSPTVFTAVTGSPEVDFYQVRSAFFLQDEWKVSPGLTLSAGIRYYLQNDPSLLSGITPRVGASWSLTKTVAVHGHAGFFTDQVSETEYAEILREDGTQRVTSTVYNPVFGAPFSGTTTVIDSKRTVSPGFRNIVEFIVEGGASKILHRGWTLNVSLMGFRSWFDPRSLNINTVLAGSHAGRRPMAPNLNIFQAQSSGTGLGDLEVITLGQQHFKRLQFSVGAIRANIRHDSDGSVLSSPQSAYTDVGEFSRVTGHALWQTYGNGSITLPWKLQSSASYYADGDLPFNITTGFDSNGDGDFNDRPQFARSMESNAVATPFGHLVLTGGTGTIRRNAGSQPWQLYLDTNLQRTFTLTPDRKATHQQTLTVNIRSSNVLNHTNVTAEGGVLGSPLFLVPYAADNGRRVEGGLRYSF